MWFNWIIDFVDFSYRAYMRLCGIIQPERIGLTFFGQKFHCDIRDFIQRRIYFFRIYEPNLTYYMKERIKSGGSVLDVGANIGYITLLASHLVGRAGAVHAIEAAPTTFAKLSANLQLNAAANVMAHNIAATASACMVEIVEGDRRNIGTNAVRTAKGTSTNLVQGRPVSDVVGPNISAISFIKIDVEGSEGPVLDDILRNLASFASLETIVSELGPSSARFIAGFQAAGFRIYALPNNYRIGATLVRRYLDRTQEGGFVTKIAVAGYDEAFTDYAFERETSAPLERTYPTELVAQ